MFNFKERYARKEFIQNTESGIYEGFNIDNNGTLKNNMERGLI